MQIGKYRKWQKLIHFLGKRLQSMAAYLP